MREFRQIKYKSDQMRQKEVVIDQIFINSLFDNSLFQKKIKLVWEQQLFPKSKTANNELSFIVEEISSVMMTELELIHSRAFQEMRVDIACLYKEVDRLRELQISNCGKIDTTGKQTGDQTTIEDQQLYDLPSIKRTICSLQEKVKEISLNSSVILDSSQLMMESRYRKDIVQERISSEMSKLEASISQQQESLEDIFNKKLEKQQKTINNILQTLNDLQPISKVEKGPIGLNTSKSTTKLKTFFGFG